MGMNLTEGCIKDIVLGVEINSPIVQIWDYRTYRNKLHAVTVSDGVFFTVYPTKLVRSAAMLACNGELQPYSVVVLDDYTTEIKHYSEGHAVMLLIRKMTILKRGDAVASKIGNPIPATEFQLKGLTSFEKSLEEKAKTLPIAALDPGNDLWSIKARIVSKTYIQNSISNEEFFNMELADSSGRILATAYNDACRKFYNLMKVNKVYQIWRYYLESEETTSHKLRLILNDDSKVKLAVENIQFSFSDSRVFNDTPLNTSVHIIGVCYRMWSSNKSEDKSRKGLPRYMILTDPSIDRSEHSIADSDEGIYRVMLSGNAAKKIKINSRPVIAIKGAKIVKKSGRRYASVNRVSQVFINPDIKEAREMMERHKHNIRVAKLEWVQHK
ncbi:replication protein A 70 kDa DNA-binding subunit-like [Planococcus citri]|uniref:replication protein A 70 kDa DNA-binding subunit-like n=1 Tax=Planococcus citri TaxID=170843 RepID=UPI0031F8CDA5